MNPKPARTHASPDHYLKYSYVAILFFLTITGFGQMPIFKRYYIADIPGLGWLAKFFITHYIHYLGAVLLLALFAYWIAEYFMVNRHRIKITASGYLRAVMLGIILVSGVLMVIRNLDGIWMPPAFIILLDLVHLGMVMAFLATAVYCLKYRKPWTQVLSNDM